MTRFRLGLGFNPALAAGAVPIPEDAARLEAGASLYFHPRLGARRAWLDRFDTHSLHLARAPFSETPDLQDPFLDGLSAGLPARVSSIGLHLCGPFHAGLGYFGLGNAFVRNRVAEWQSRRLMEGLCALGRPILLENADLYPLALDEALGSLEWTNHLARDYEGGIILDLAHLIVAAHNLRVAPQLLVGRVDLDLVRVLHLSGIVRGRDGNLHDGHTEPVAPEVWSLLEELLPLLPEELDVVLEHTDPSWAEREEAFRSDWTRLRELALSAAPAPPPEIDREAVAIGYMANVVIPQRFPALVDALGRRDLGALVRAWGRDYVARAGESEARLAVLRRSENFWGQRDTLDPIADFARFVGQMAEEAP